MRGLAASAGGTLPPAQRLYHSVLGLAAGLALGDRAELVTAAGRSSSDDDIIVEVWETDGLLRLGRGLGLDRPGGSLGV